MIETKRLLLRPFTTDDASDVLEYLSEPAVNCFACMKLDSLESAKAEMKKRAADQYYFAIVLKESGKVIGEIFAHPEGTDPEDEMRDTFSPCWMLNLNYTGRGYAYEAAHAYFDHLFHAAGARRIYAYTEDYNLPSQKLCEKLGMRREGLFCEFVSFVNNPDGTPRYENTMEYAVLKKEWQEKNRGGDAQSRMIGLVEDPAAKRDVARAILEALPEWFGIPESREAYISESGGQVMVAAWEQDRPIGFACLKETGKDTVELAVMGVRKEYHRRGIGRALFEAAKHLALVRAYSFMQVKTVQMGRNAEYDATNRFYLSLGFREFEVLPTLWDERNPCQIYVMALG